MFQSAKSADDLGVIEHVAAFTSSIRKLSGKLLILHGFWKSDSMCNEDEARTSSAVFGLIDPGDREFT